MKSTNLMGATGAVCTGAALLWLAPLQVAVQPARSLPQQATQNPAQSSEVRLQELLAQTETMPQSLSPEQESAANQRARQLYEIWLERDQRDVAADILPYLQDEYGIIRDSAARMLGRLESPAAEDTLSHRQQEMAQLFAQKRPEKAHKISVGEDTLQLAVGRIQARGLKGKAKLNALVHGFGLSFDDLVWLSQKVKKEGGGGGGPESPAAFVVDEAIDLLYTMAKRGEDVRGLAKRLTLNTAEQMKIKSGSLPGAEEPEFLLDYFTSNKFDGGDYRLYQHLARLGPPAYKLVVQRLQQLRPQTRGVQLPKARLLRVAAWMGNEDAVPLLKSFKNDPDSDVRREAELMLQLIGWKALAAPLP